MIYLDNNATTRMDARVLEAMRPYQEEVFYNPSSPYQPARGAALALEDARVLLRSVLDAPGYRVVFTGGGTESNVLALRGALGKRGGRNRVVISAVEHASVRETARRMAGEGWRVDTFRVLGDGAPDLDHLAGLLADDVAVVSAMAANNETGMVFPVAELAKLAHAAGALMHTDAAQVPGRLAWRVGASGADLVTLCAHKVHGPKGVGALLVRDGVALDPQLTGGDQEYGWRAGTENVAGIVGLARALDLAVRESPEALPRMADLRNRFEAEVARRVGEVSVVGNASPRLANTSLLCIEGVATESLLARLDMAGILVSSGSACTSGSPEASPVLAAMGWDSPGRGVVRVSLSRDTTGAEMDAAAAAIGDAVRALRNRA